MTAGGVAFLVAILGTPLLMRWLVRNRIGQHVREDGPASHSAKAGTPTMGGLTIVGAVAVGYAVSHVGGEVTFSATGYLVIITVFLYGVIGFLDDWIKVRHQRSLGLNKRAKLAAQVAVGALFAELAVHWAHTSTSLSFTRLTAQGVQLGQWGWAIFAIFVLVGTSNAVNLTDGLDGPPGRRRSASPSWGSSGTGYFAMRAFSTCCRPRLSTSPSSRWHWPVRASGSYGGTPPRRRS